jgi:hypothetical protein
MAKRSGRIALPQRTHPLPSPAGRVLLLFDWELLLIISGFRVLFLKKK